MAIRIGSYTFEGPYSNTSTLQDRAGLYAILTLTGTGNYEVVDIGESATVKSRVESHDRAPCWQRNAKQGLYYAVLYTPHLQDAGRRNIEQALRDLYAPACGVR